MKRLVPGVLNPENHTNLDHLPTPCQQPSTGCDELDFFGCRLEVDFGQEAPLDDVDLRSGVDQDTEGVSLI